MTHTRCVGVLSALALPLALAACNPLGDLDSPALASRVQNSGEFKTLDEQYLEIAQQIPGFAGVYEGNDGTLVAKIAPSPDLTAQQESSDVITVGEVRDAILEVMGTEVFTDVPNDPTISSYSRQAFQEMQSSLPLRLENTKYTFEQLTTWLHEIMALDLDGAMIYDANEGKNNVYLGVETQAQADVAKAHIAKLTIPDDGVEIEVVGPYNDLVLRGEELQKYMAQKAKAAAEAPLHTAAEQHVERSSLPLVGGVQVTTNKSACTYGFSAKRNGVRGLVTNYHCTANKAQVDGDVIRQDGQYIGFETVDPPPFYCGIFWGECRYSDAAFFKNDGPSPWVAAPRIAGIGPAAYDKTYTYSSPVQGVVLSTKQDAHYIAVTSRTGFTRLVVTNTCTYLRTQEYFTRLITIECGAVAKPESGYPNIQGGDSGSPVITRNSSGAVLVAEIFGANPLNGTIWMNNIGGVWRDLGALTVKW
jgi:hypothetical protein